MDNAIIIGSSFILVIVIIVVVVGVWWYYKNQGSVSPAPISTPISTGTEFQVKIINKTGIELQVKMPDNTTKKFNPDETYPQSGTIIIKSGTLISYNIPSDDASKQVSYSFKGNGIPGDSNAQTWYLTKGGIKSSTQTFRVSNDTNTQESCCSDGSVTFQPYIIWNSDPLLTQKLPDIKPGTSIILTHYRGGDTYIPIEFRYPNNSYVKGSSALPYKIWKLEGIDINPNMNVRLLLGHSCEPLYPKDTRCDGSKPEVIDYNNTPMITFKMGQGVGSTTPNTNIEFGNTPFGKQFCIATDIIQNGVTKEAGQIILCSNSTPDPTKWKVPITSVINNKLYVGAGTDDTNIIYSKNSKGEIDHMPYTICNKDTNYDLYIWGGNQSNTDQCKNPMTTRKCDVYGPGMYNCVGHLSSDAGNYKDPCNNTTATNTCTADADCKKCWTPRYCNTDIDIPRCYPVKSATQQCTKTSMCGDGLQCINGYCGQSPLGGACTKLGDCASGNWCYKGKCVEKSAAGGPCDPSVASGITCLSDYCCVEHATAKWIQGTLTQKCPLGYQGADVCRVSSDRNSGGSSQMCRQCTDYLNNTSGPNPHGCSVGYMQLCGDGIPVNTCSSDTTFIEDTMYPNTGLCIKCPEGFKLNPKYKVNNKWGCSRISTNTDVDCPDMCIKSATSTGALCVYNNRQACIK
jgi:hypothetical protein